MTLVVSVLTHDYVVQVSDRCMTFECGDGAVRFEDGHNKAVLFERRIAFGYTGAGQIEGLRTDEWLQERLGEGEDVATGLQAVLDGLTRSFPPASTRHAFLGVGWGFANGPAPQLVCIGNCVDSDGGEIDPQPTFSRVKATISPGAQTFIHQLPERIQREDWTRLQTQVLSVIEQGNDPAEVGDVLIEAVRRVATESDDVGTCLMVNCLPFTVATGSDQGFVISDRPSMHHPSFAYLPPGQGEPGGLAPLLVSAEGGWLARDFKQVEGPNGEESVEMSFRLTRDGASPPALVNALQARIVTATTPVIRTGEDRTERPLLVRLGQEVQEVSRSVGSPARLSHVEKSA
jgi:hypothetical protein